MHKKEISIDEAAHWIAKMAAKDGFITNNERRLMKEFADSFEVDVNILYNLAEKYCDNAEKEVEPVGPIRSKDVDLRSLWCRYCVIKQNSNYWLGVAIKSTKTPMPSKTFIPICTSSNAFKPMRLNILSNVSTVHRGDMEKSTYHHNFSDIATMQRSITWSFSSH